MYYSDVVWLWQTGGKFRCENAWWNRLDRAILAAPDEQLIATEDKERLLSALEKLSYREREILKLRYGFADCGPESYRFQFTVAEVAQIFRIPPQRVRVIQARAEQRLAEMFKV